MQMLARAVRTCARALGGDSQAVGARVGTGTSLWDWWVAKVSAASLPP